MGYENGGPGQTGEGWDDDGTKDVWSVFKGSIGSIVMSHLGIECEDSESKVEMVWVCWAVGRERLKKSQGWIHACDQNGGQRWS